MERKGGHLISLLVKNIVTIDSCREKKSMFFKSVAPCMFINKYKSLWGAQIGLDREEERRRKRRRRRRRNGWMGRKEGY